MTDAEGTKLTGVKLPDVIILSHKLAEYESRAQLHGYETERKPNDALGNWLSVYQDNKFGTVSCSAFKNGSVITNVTTHSDKADAVHRLAEDAALMLRVVFNVAQRPQPRSET